MRFQNAEFDRQEVVFLERVLIARPIPTQELDQLVVGQHVPVLADDGDVDAPELLVAEVGLGRQPHGGAHVQDLLWGRPQHLRHPVRIRQLPVPPHEQMHAIRKMGLGNRFARRCPSLGFRSLGFQPSLPGFRQGEGSKRALLEEFPAIHQCPSGTWEADDPVQDNPRRGSKFENRPCVDFGCQRDLVQLNEFVGGVRLINVPRSKN